ncbi:MAG: DNA cytosine methyltransferase [Bifidobacteriaceae bacterium]|nr:DNA cytosine methyltransferase [Bifidobacteriaceae bacterium]
MATPEPSPPAAPATTRKLRAGSLFSGCGGLDLAVEEVFDAETVWFAETDPAAAKVLARRWPGVPNLGDVALVDWASVAPVDVLAGGFPCQDVSSAGSRHGLKQGTRSGLWARMALAVSILRPRWVVAENVIGLLSAPAVQTPPEGPQDDPPEHPRCGPGAGTGRAGAVRGVGLGDGVVGDGPRGPVRAAGVVVADLALLGYGAAWASLPASLAGACHSRARVFILAWPAA